ncbi:MAG: hypothetical protein AAGC55_00310, partial [Myxococcota bacterium]
MVDFCRPASSVILTGVRVLFCGTGWLPLIDFIRDRAREHALPLELQVWDRQRPLVEEIVDVEVLLPANATIDVEIINAARRLRLIQQPAAGIEDIDLEA